MIKTTTLSGNQSGKKILILGAIHGNEVCGPEAIAQVMQHLQTQPDLLERGSVTFVPITNQKAYEHGVRYVEENLNRVIKREDTPQTCEAQIANEVCGLIESHDVLLDLHSFTSPGIPFVFLDYPSAENTAFMKALNQPYSVEGWPTMYVAHESGIVSYDTQRYAQESGKIALTVECGQHSDPMSIDVAERMIYKTLRHFNLIATADRLVSKTITRRVIMKELFVREHEADHLLVPYENFFPVSKDDVIAKRHNGFEIVSSVSGCIVLPKSQSKAGEEFFYLGEFVN